MLIVSNCVSGLVLQGAVFSVPLLSSSEFDDAHFSGYWMISTEDSELELSLLHITSLSSRAGTGESCPYKD